MVLMDRGAEDVLSFIAHFEIRLMAPPIRITCRRRFFILWVRLDLPFLPSKAFRFFHFGRFPRCERFVTPYRVEPQQLTLNLLPLLIYLPPCSLPFRSVRLPV